MTGSVNAGDPGGRDGVLRRQREAFLARPRPFQERRAILTAIELDLFTRMSDGGPTATDLARAAGLHPRGLELLLNALVALGLLAKTGEAFWNTGFSRTHPVSATGGAAGLTTACTGVRRADHFPLKVSEVYLDI